MAGFTSDCRPAYRRARKRPFRMVATREYKVIGTRPIRPDGADKVTGRAEVGADIRLPGMLYRRVKRTPLPPPPGGKAVAPAAAFPPAPDISTPLGEQGGPSPLRYQRDAILASSKVLYVGHPVAAVCASDPHVAEDALDLIEVEYEALPFVQDVREAMAAGAR